MTRIRRFGILQTAKLMAVMYFLLSAVFVVPVALILMATGVFHGGEDALGGLIGGIGMIFIPFIYALLGFIFVAIGCAIYNVVASWVGGIEVELDS